MQVVKVGDNIGTPTSRGGAVVMKRILRSDVEVVRVSRDAHLYRRGEILRVVALLHDPVPFAMTAQQHAGLPHTDDLKC